MTINRHASSYLSAPEIEAQQAAESSAREDAVYRGLVLDQVRELNFNIWLRAVEIVNKRRA